MCAQDTDKTLPFDFDPEDEGKKGGESGQGADDEALRKKLEEELKNQLDEQQGQDQAQPPQSDTQQPAPPQPPAQQPEPPQAEQPAAPAPQSTQRTLDGEAFDAQGTQKTGDSSGQFSEEAEKAFEDFFSAADSQPIAPMTPAAPPPAPPPGAPPQTPDQPAGQFQPPPEGGGGGGDQGKPGDTTIGKRRRRRAVRRFAMDMFIPMMLGGVFTVILYYLVLPYLPGEWGKSVRVTMDERGLIPVFCTLFLFWHLSHVLFRYILRVRPEFRIMSMGLLPAGSAEITNYDLQMIGHNASIVDNKYDGGTLLTRRLLLAVAHLQIRRDIAELGDLLRRRAEADRARASNAYSIPNFIFWAIPILGFIGTVLGIALAVAGLGKGLSGTIDSEALNVILKGVTDKLGVAFDTTLVALLMSIIAYLTQTLVRQQEAQLLADVEDYLTYRLQSRIKTETSEDRMEMIMREAVREMTNIQQQLSTENQKNSRMTMQTMMTTQQSMKLAIEKFPEMLEHASTTSAKMLEDATAATGTVTEEVRQKLQTIVEKIGTQLEQAFANVGSVMDTMVVSQAETGKEVAAKIESAGEQLVESTAGAIHQLADEYKKMGEELGKAAKKTTLSMSETIVGVGDEAKLKIQGIGNEFLEKTADQAESLYTNASTEFQKTIEPLKGFLESVVASVEKGIEEGNKLVAVEDSLSKNLMALSQAKKLDEALDGLRYALSSIQPILSKLKEPMPLRIDLGGVELPVSGSRSF